MESNGPTGQQITEQAVGWLIRLDAGTATIEAFEAWRSADPRHASAFAQMAAVWKRTGDLRGAPPSEQQAAPPVAALKRVGRGTMLRALAASGVGVIGLDQPGCC